MKENNANKLDLQALNIDALIDASQNGDSIIESPPDTPQISIEPEGEIGDMHNDREEGLDDIEVAEIEASEVENVDAQDTPTAAETSDNKWKREKRSHPPREKKPRPQKEKKVRQPKEPITPITDAALPIGTCAISFVIALASIIIDRFVFPISQELLLPLILELVALAIPAYLCMTVTSGNKSAVAQLKEIGLTRFHSGHLFFTVFAALFTASASLVLTLVFGGASAASKGLTLLGSFTAGVNEYTASYPYLIITYAVIPAIAEEMLFRGVVLSRLNKVSFPLAATVSCLLSALWSLSIGGFIPSLFISIMLVFVFYTTGSLIAPIILHLLINLYKLFVEANVAAYFLSSQNDLLLLVTVALALLISGLLFFSESARIYRSRAKSISEGKERSAKKLVNFKSLPHELASAVVYKPSLILSIACVGIFIAVVLTRHFT